MFDKLKQTVFDYRLGRYVRGEAPFPKFKDIRSVLVIYESDLLEKNPDIRKVRDALLAEDIDVVTWGFVLKKEVTTAILPQSRILGLKDVTLWGTLRESVVTDLSRRRYDVLIDLTQHPCLPLHYVAMLARADFKAGMHLTDGIHHLLIDTEAKDTPVFLFEQIMYYLKTIHSNDVE